MLKINTNTIPSTPGAYIFKNKLKKPIYIGKAINLQSRLKTYFEGELAIGDKTQKMLGEAAGVEYIQTQSETEALILEAKLIKTFKPYFNVLMKDDKMYQYIAITVSETFPKVIRVRKLNDKDIFFGPYPQGTTVFQIYKSLRRIFKFRDCSQAKFRRYERLKRGCLYYDLGLCSAPCAQSIGLKEYRKSIKELIRFLNGDTDKLLKEWEKSIEKAAKQLRFEKAAFLKERISQIQYLRQKPLKPEKYIENPNLRQDLFIGELEVLLTLLTDTYSFQLPKISKSLNRQAILEKFKIEVFDISHLSGKLTVGSKICFIGGEFSKKDYRRYRLRGVEGISDTASMREVLERRLKSKTDLPLPDLIIIDGGKPQVSACKAILEELNMNIPFLGIAKRRERLIGYYNSDFKEMSLKKDSPVMNLIRRLRDEAHRFAISYQRLLREKEL